MCVMRLIHVCDVSHECVASCTKMRWATSMNEWWMRFVTLVDDVAHVSMMHATSVDQPCHAS